MTQSINNQNYGGPTFSFGQGSEEASFLSSTPHLVSFSSELKYVNIYVQINSFHPTKSGGLFDFC
jgi:hypothetical protein